MQIRIESSDKKRLISQSSQKKEIEMVFIDKESSRQFDKVREQIMKTVMRKQSHPSLFRKKSSAVIIQKERQVNVKEFKTHMTDHSPDEKKQENQKQVSEKVSIRESQQKVIQEHIKKIPYKLSYKSLAIELIVGYSVTMAVLYFITLSSSFPFFELILVIAFTVSIKPWKSSSLLMLVALGIIIGNYFLNLSVFTYPSIIICYYAVMVFNQNYKRKQVFILVLIFTIVFGFIIMPAIFNSLNNQGKSIVYPYIFPILMLILRTTVSCAYLFIDYTATIFLQLPLFLNGLQYGVVLSYDLQSIQFWYLLVTFSLQIINDRTRFLTNILVSIVKNCNKTKQEQSVKLIPKGRDYPVLPAHANGYACLHSFHLFLLVYIYSQAGLYTAPFQNSTFMNTYYLNPSYKPVIVWLLTSVYEIMSILLSKSKKNIMFFGFISNKWWRCVLRGFLLSLGMWAFYLGLNLGSKTYTPTNLS